MENWKPILDYEGIYEVSDLGRVRRVARQFIDSNGRPSGVGQMIMKEGENHDVILRKDGKYKTRLIRSLVAQSFLGLPYGTDITHLDRNFGNARLDNLVSTEKYRTMDSDWRDIPGWEGEYQASRFGQIRSLDRYVKVRGGYRFFPGVIRAMDESEDGYYQVCLYRQGKAVVTTNAHIFVARAWIPNPENKPTVNHVDGNKHNNCIENLEWATYIEQQAHVKRIGLRKKPWWSLEQNGPVGGDWNDRQRVKVRCIETGVEYDSLTAAGLAIGQSAAEIKQSVDHHKCVKGFHFVKAHEPDYDFGVKSLEGEIWKDIPGYEGRYKISSMKRVKSVERQVKCARGYRTVPEKLLSLSTGLTLIDDFGAPCNYKIDTIYQSVFSNKKKLFNIG